MNLHESPELAAFRSEVRGWIEAAIPPRFKERRQGIVGRNAWTREQVRPLIDALAARGWLAPAWPKAHGGAGFDVLRMVIFQEEWTRAGIPFRHALGMDMLGPILMKWGTPEQQARFLPPILRQEVSWCQGYSEPGAGSDLASLAMRAEPAPGGFTLTGQKIWTSFAHEADWMFVIARTDSQARRKQEGISFFLAEMRSPGITVRPLVTIDGFTHFNEVFFDRVLVPREQMVGELNKGWSAAKAVLGHERFTHYRANPILIGRSLENLKAAARAAPAGASGAAAWDDPALRRQVAALEMDTDCMRAMRYRTLSTIGRGEERGPELMIFKNFGAELMQRIVELHHGVPGPAGVAWSDEPLGEEIGELARYDCNIRSATIAAGSAEIQRNLIAGQILGLPR
ncbi:MAG: acyl-CoA dehydrogenase family protein [Candidatus Lambdaproteobacteria bacterium]|nr:acyl-CoA dehydrogenase family protein [Candidatus Lambdaproteobacteria bacterium]